MKVATHYNNNYSQPSFTGYKEAMAYAKHTRFYNKLVNKKLYNCNLGKYEGIQEGLKTFEGLSMKQIAFALTDLHSINMIRGCINHCLHCYANAQPFITRAPFESFKQILDDILALKNRLGINPVSHRGSKYVDCYFDADGMDMHLFDKEGKKHDAIELGRLIHKSTGMRVVFDTNGWKRTDTEKQKTAEEYVRKFLQKGNSKHFYQINISLNPFNPKYIKSLKDGYNPKTYSPLIPIDEAMHPAQKPEKLKKAEDNYRDYIQNEANVLFTFTPLLLKGKLGAIVRGLKGDVPNMEDCYLSEYAKTLSNMLDCLYFMYLSDFQGKQKVIKDSKMIDKAIKKYVRLFNKNTDFLFSSGRMEKFYKVKNKGSLEGIEKIDKMRARAENNYEMIRDLKRLSAADLMYLKMINSDGKVYLYDNYSIIPTDIQLNTENKPLKTPFWMKIKDFVVKTEMIDII